MPTLTPLPPEAKRMALASALLNIGAGLTMPAQKMPFSPIPTALAAGVQQYMNTLAQYRQYLAEQQRAEMQRQLREQELGVKKKWYDLQRSILERQVKESEEKRKMEAEEAEKEARAAELYSAVVQALNQGHKKDDIIRALDSIEGAWHLSGTKYFERMMKLLEPQPEKEEKTEKLPERIRTVEWFVSKGYPLKDAIEQTRNLYGARQASTDEKERVRQKALVGIVTKAYGTLGALGDPEEILKEADKKIQEILYGGKDTEQALKLPEGITEQDVIETVEKVHNGNAEEMLESLRKAGVPEEHLKVYREVLRRRGYLQ